MGEGRKYFLELGFIDTPDCEKCMLSTLVIDRDCVRMCPAIGYRPICPKEGALKDCPLKPMEEAGHVQV